MIQKLDDVPYYNQSRPPWRRRYSIEYWTIEGEHDFRPFWTYGGAVRWTRKQLLPRP